MITKRKIIVLVVFLFMLFFMMTYASGTPQNETIATRSVTFIDGYNNEVIDTQVVEVGGSATAPSAPNHEDQTFLGWFNENNVEITSFDNILHDLIIYAKYESAPSYLVTFYDTISRQVIKEEIVAEGRSASAPTAQAYDGYTFSGWSRGYTNVEGNITVNTVYRTNTAPNVYTYYTISFVDGMTNEQIGVQSVREGLTATAPVPKTYKGYVFVGWSDNFGNVNSNKTITSIYEEDLNNNNISDKIETKYTITFIASKNGYLVEKAEFSGLLSGLSYEKQGVKVPTPVAEAGYAFRYWYRDSNSNVKTTINLTDLVSGNRTYTSVFGIDTNNNEIADEDENKYTVSFNTGNKGYFDNDNKNTSLSYKDILSNLKLGKQITLPELKVKNGYVFNGWIVNGQLIYNWEDIVLPATNEDTTLVITADIVAKSGIQVTFNAGEGVNVSPTSKEVTFDTAYGVLPSPLKDGYEFIGWVLNIGDNELVNANTIVANSENHTLYAKWSEAIVYNINYELNGGTNNAANPKTYTVESPLITILVPTKTGYDFVEWAEGDAIAAGSTGDKTFTAIWSEAIVYNINYELNGGGHHVPNPSTYTVEDTPLTINPASRRGYYFDGWWEGAVKNNVIAAGSTGDKTFTAHWTVVEYTITYKLEGGINASNPSSYNIENTPILLATPTKAGYTFMGWEEENPVASNGIVANGIPTNGIGDRVFKAKWSEAIVYNINYELNGGTNNAANPKTYTVEDTPVTILAPTKAGYTFIEWTEGNTIAAGSTGDKTFTAVWSEAIVYNINYELNGGTNNAANPKTYTVESPLITILAPTKAGYTFIEWTEGNTIAAGSTGDKTFTAVWSEAVVYNINYELNGGTNNAANPKTYTVESPLITILAPTKAGYTFVEWAEGDTIAAGSSGDKTFTAIWSEAIVYNINYELNGGTNNAANPKTYTVEDTPVTILNPSKTGYTFVKWAEGNKIVAGSTGDKTFTAEWEIKTYTVTFVDWNNTVLKSETVEHGKAATAPADPTRTGYEFTGWEPTSFNEITGDLTIKAQYKNGKIIVTLDPNGGSVSPNEIEVTLNLPYDKLPTPTWAGHIFMGWFLSDKTEVTNERLVKIEGDHTLYAQWADGPVIIPQRCLKFNSGSILLGFNYDTCPEARNIKEVIIPTTQVDQYGNTFEVKSINGTAFESNTVIESVVIPKTVTYISQKAFMNCKNLKTVVLNEGLIEIQGDAFNGTKLETVTIPASVKIIGANAFNIPSLTEIKVKGKSSEADFTTIHTSWKGSCLNVLWNQ